MVLFADAQNDSLLTVNLKEIIVRENRIQVAAIKKASGITILNREKISNMGAGSVAEIISHAAGVDIRQRGVNGIQSDAGIRGSSFDQVVILVNGIKMSDPQTGHHSMNLPVDIASVQQIEIYKGSAARVFGENAFAGAINIVTSIPEGNTVSSAITAGDYSLFGGHASVVFGNIDFRNMVSVSHNQSGGYRYNTDYRKSDIFWQSEIFTSGGRIEILTGYSDRDFGANGFYANPDYKDQYEIVKTSLVSVGFKPHFNGTGFKISNRIYWRNNNDEYLLIRNDPSYYHNQHSTNVAGLDLNSSWNNRAGITGIGLDISYAGISSNRLGVHSRGVLTLFAEHRFTFISEKVSFTPGLQFNYYSDFGANLLPGLEAGINIADDVMIYINSGYTYRIPTYTDLYYEDPLNSSNPLLDPEYALSGEFGFRKSGRNGISYQANIFSRRGINLVDRVRNSTDDKWTPENISRTDTRGADLEITVYPSIISGNSHLPLYNISLGYTYIQANVYGNDFLYSKFSFENLKHHLVSSVSLHYPGNLYHDFSFRYYDRVTLDDYSVIDTRVGYKGNNLDIYINISNLAGTKYSETNLVPMPGRWISAGVAYTLRRNQIK